jgi:hypothetical protein
MVFFASGDLQTKKLYGPRFKSFHEIYSNSYFPMGNSLKLITHNIDFPQGAKIHVRLDSDTLKSVEPGRHSDDIRITWAIRYLTSFILLYNCNEIRRQHLEMNIFLFTYASKG